MKWFLNLTTRTKLFLGFGLMVVFLIIIILSAYSGITSIRKSQTALYQEDFLPAVTLAELKADQNRVRSQLLEMMMVKDSSKQRALENDIRERAKEVDEGLKVISESLKGQPQELKKLDELISVRTAYAKTRDEQIALIYKGKIDEAEKLGLAVQEERYKKIRDIAMELGEKKIADAKERIAQAEKNAKGLTYTFLIIGALVFLLSAGIILFFSKIIAKPLMEITSAAEKISSGDLTVDLPSLERHDEVGNLARAFSMMTENLRMVNREIQEGMNVLASSSAEILTSTTELASVSAETSTAVSETTATIEEVKQTARLASEKSKGVSDSAQQAALVAQQGQVAVIETVSGINLIKQHMESVAESIVKLSEQNQVIGEIISTVNDLAQQSNLLAVNAAIEASKAGEQGKGFAVVAQEVKSLAEQSKQATVQVRTILSDIQKATAAAVMTSEQVSKAVDASVKQAAESGDSIARLTESVSEASNALMQIVASSQQQLVGMDQIALAMENIRQASQQNAAGTKQVEQSAHGLNELGQKLKEMVARYKV